MSFGKLYGFEGNSRSVVLLVIAKENNLDVELIEVRPPNVSPEYLKLNPLARVPTFVGTNGFVLTEAIAIAIFFAQQAEDTTLLGNSKEDFASIIRWMSFTNTEVLPKLGGWFRPFIGKDPFNRARVEENKKAALTALKVLERHLQGRAYLVGERLTLADFFAASMVSRGFAYVLDRPWRAEHPSISKWYQTVTGHSSWRAVVPAPTLIDEALTSPPTKGD